ncbi:hypothetical protein [Kibdelosporangium aridum]|uniref:hypothetical protein n=1 Tax=Kibdelosporangium aridum TaxID=2030 RepID=UPI0007C5258C|nr:hypothetical protein [Kibdelosporangium aridum]
MVSSGPEAIELAALAAAQARIAELENEVKILRKAAAAVEQGGAPKARFALVAELVVEDVPVKQAFLRWECPAAGSTTPEPARRPPGLFARRG